MVVISVPRQVEYEIAVHAKILKHYLAPGLTFEKTDPTDGKILTRPAEFLSKFLISREGQVVGWAGFKYVGEPPDDHMEMTVSQADLL